jgi:hypothetical protein
MESQHIKKVDFSEKELIILYNYIPRLIEKSAILVNLSPNYYTNGKQETLLTEDTRGNYWIIATDYDIYWLFPITKLNGKINPSVNEAFNLLFQNHNYDNSYNREFILKKPAKVSPVRNTENWILAEPGFIDFANLPLLPIEALNGKDNNSPIIEQNSIPSVSQDDFENYIYKTDSEINQLKSQIQELTQAREHIETDIKEIKDKYSDLENRVKLPVKAENNISTNNQVESNQPETTSNQHHSINTATALNLTPEESRIVETYNSNPVVISQQAKQVSETNTSITKRSQGINEAVVLEKQAQGHYWLIGRETLYLMPRRGFNINRSTVDTFKALFKCHGSKATNKFKLIKPAKLVMIGSSQTWQLTERGIIEFE